MNPHEECVEREAAYRDTNAALRARVAALESEIADDAAELEAAIRHSATWAEREEKLLVDLAGARNAIRDAATEWSSDARQQPMHTWHGREDWAERHADALRRAAEPHSPEAEALRDAVRRAEDAVNALRLPVYDAWSDGFNQGIAAALETLRTRNAP